MPKLVDVIKIPQGKIVDKVVDAEKPEKSRRVHNIHKVHKFNHI